MKRLKITRGDIAELNNLHLALYKAAKGKRNRSDIQHFLSNALPRLNRLSQDILAGHLPYGRYRHFTIYDPKQRDIYAACFEDRIFHHALMNLAGPVLEKAMHHSSYACLPSKGVHRAVEKVQQGLQRYACYGKVDIQGYFAAIHHELLLEKLSRKFKGAELFECFHRILSCPYQPADGAAATKGLPIGSLTSQYFANYFLDDLDRLLAADPRVQQHIRYMDDIVWWCRDKTQARAVLAEVTDWMTQHQLTLKPDVQLQNSRQGISYCGYRISAGAIRLSQRKKRRYTLRSQHWENLYQAGAITDLQLQRGYDSVYAVTRHCQSRAWRQNNLQYYPAIEV